MADRHTTNFDDVTGFIPTVCGHTNMTDGMRLHTIDPSEDRDIDLFDGDRPPEFAGVE